jgi:hypothetical protein
MHEAIDRQRRHIVGSAAMALAASHLGLPRPAIAEAVVEVDSY